MTCQGGQAYVTRRFALERIFDVQVLTGGQNLDYVSAPRIRKRCAQSLNMKAVFPVATGGRVYVSRRFALERIFDVQVLTGRQTWTKGPAKDGRRT
jgi:hypothetical protein